ncbi:uncharacterized protein [Fopius arisanus]|uniref:TRM7_1 protein n=1 Tax=Fopius arisanus TaxID=64838 RepID=A0A0C9QD17_9HYME|nr:PREDICTED: uncharacterized protein LOC105267614 isoform X2 [Fopius arisanus]
MTCDRNSILDTSVSTFVILQQIAGEGHCEDSDNSQHLECSDESYIIEENSLIADNDSNEKLKRSVRLDEHRGMKIHTKDILTATRATVPRTVVRTKSYRNLVGQWFLGPCGANEYHNESIVEEDETIDMVEAGPSHEFDESPGRVSRSENHEINGENWRAEEDADSSDKDDEEVEEADLRPVTPIPDNPTVSGSILDPPEIKVTEDESLHQMAHEYRENFDGFAQINCFESIEEMHDFIKNTLSTSPPPGDTPSSKQDRYLDLLLNERPENRFRRLLETVRVTVRRVLTRNEDILGDLFASASLETFPSPLAPIDEYEMGLDENEDGDTSMENPRDLEVEENMKRWYMIEMIGLWLRMITDVKGYRGTIKKRVLMKSWGIENDRYEGIAVPLRYK